MRFTILLFLFALNVASCQNIPKDTTDYVVIGRSDAGSVNTDDNLKKYSKKESEDLRFSKELASKISKDLFSKIDTILICKESATVKKKDTISYIVYDFILKKEVSINELKNSLIFGIKRIGIYKWPVICTTFLNGDKISCVCKSVFECDFIKDDEFINTIKADTELRLKAASKN
jgi:hypothetical protein